MQIAATIIKSATKMKTSADKNAIMSPNPAVAVKRFVRIVTMMESYAWWLMYLIAVGHSRI